MSIGVSRVNVTQNVVLGWKYVLESSPNNVDWIPTGSPFFAESESFVTEFGADGIGRFYRLRLVERPQIP
jgi:hypothetical protein